MSFKLAVLVFATVIAVGYGGGIGYGEYPGQYGGYGGYPGQYPYRPDGPPGAHPGCPLCDSSVYSYCSHKQAHDSCCCDHAGYNRFTCRRADCKSLYANSCQEYHLITNCCCVDLHRSALAPVVPFAPVAPVAPIVAPVVPVPA